MKKTITGRKLEEATKAQARMQELSNDNRHFTTLSCVFQGRTEFIQTGLSGNSTDLIKMLSFLTHDVVRAIYKNNPSSAHYIVEVLKESVKEGIRAAKQERKEGR